MPLWLSAILEILKMTIPALIVFLTVFYLLRQYLEKQQQSELLRLRQTAQQEVLPLRLQAYERLSLLCERISLPNLLLRLPQDDLSASELRVALLVSIQQEYEHNLTQQIYVSQPLWEIIKMAKDDVINSVSLVAESVDPKAKAPELAANLMAFLERRSTTGPEKALEAIKKEVGLLF